MKAFLYSSVGDTLWHYDLDVEAATLKRRSPLQLPSTIQYGWPHPSGRFLYLSTTDSGRGSKGITGAVHRLCALRRDADGTLSFHGPAQNLRQRPIHNSVDREGRFALTCYNAPPHLSVHRIASDGTLEAEVGQRSDLDLGIFPHQILAAPSNRTVYMVSRGNLATASRPLELGAIKLFGFEAGHLAPLASVTPGGQASPGYGPRHLDFHPTQPWVYVLVELQNQLHMHRMQGDAMQPEPDFVLPSTQAPADPDIRQVTGAIHVHPRGHVVYATNRVSATTHPVGAFPFVGGEDNIAVFRIDPQNGEPTPLQCVDPQGFHIRAFAIDPSGRLLIAASLAAMTVQRAGTTVTVPAGLSLFRIAADGRLDFERRYDVELAPGVQQMWVCCLE
jgi:6-phosphogluconolactonase (cycloisomerase 2 family)